MMTKNPIRFAWLGLVAVFFSSAALAQIEVERMVTANMMVPDNGSRSTSFIWSNAGISVVSSTAITLNFSSPFSSNPAVLSQLSSSLTFGTGGGTPVTASLFTAGSLSSFSQTFITSDGFDGNWQSNNRWDLSVTDNQGGGIAKLDSWKLAVEGTSTDAGTTMDLGSSGTVRVASGASSGQISSNVSTGSSGNTATMEAGLNKTLEVTGGISGAGAFSKTGLGTVVLGGTAANTFTGNTTVNAGTLKLQKTGGATGISASTIAVNSGGTLLLGAANQISDNSAMTLAGGTLDTGGFADRVGQLTVSQNSAINGLVTSAGGGMPTGNDFLFSGVDLSSYGTSSGAALNLGSGYNYGATINIASSNFTGWSGYSTTSINNFGDKVMFGTTGMKASISFNGSTGLTYVTAIPEPGVYVAMGILMMLVGLTEGRRRMALRERAKGS